MWVSLKELVEWIARNLVDHPDEVRVSQKETDRTIVYELSVHPSDTGKIIGKQGRMIRAIRLVTAAGHLPETRRIHIELV